MARKRIRYMLHAFDVPFGGIQQIRRQVRILAGLGYDAAIVVDSDKDAHFYGEPVPRIFDRDFAATSDDICVVPEGYRQHALALARTPATLICYCQNHHYLHRMFAPGENFRAFRIATVACCSRQTANYVERYHDAERVALLPCAVDLPAEAADARDLAVAFMPRKAPQDVGVIHHVFRCRHPAHADVRWIRVDGLDHAEALAKLRRCAVFLSLSHREGFGLPPVEAMMAGTLVVGFHGGGGLDYATPRNGFWREEGDLVGCADALGDALTLLRAGRAETRDMLDEGRRTAARYVPELLQDALVAFWDAQFAA